MGGPKRIRPSGQILTWAIVALAIIAYPSPRISLLLVYDRQAILGGELWRLMTAPLVHFSPSHIFWNVLVFGAAGIAIHASGFRNFWLVCCLAATIPSLTFLLISPEVARYGGLSGLATGAVAYCCLCSALTAPKTRKVWLLILLCMGIKTLAEGVMGSPLFAKMGETLFRVLPLAHVMGFLGAFAATLLTWPNITLNKTPAGKKR